MTLEAASPAIDLLARKAGQNVDRLTNGFQLFRFRQLPGLFMMIAMPRYIMSGCMNRLDRVGVTFRQSAAGNEGRLEIVLFQEAQNPPNCHTGSVFASGILLSINPAFGIRFQTFGALIVEDKINRTSVRLRPMEFFS